MLQALYTGTTNAAGQKAAVFFIFLFIAFWSSCIDATQYLYMSEIFPTDIRGQGTAVGMVRRLMPLAARSMYFDFLTLRF